MVGVGAPFGGGEAPTLEEGVAGGSLAGDPSQGSRQEVAKEGRWWERDTKRELKEKQLVPAGVTAVTRKWHLA